MKLSYNYSGTNIYMWYTASSFDHHLEAYIYSRLVLCLSVQPLAFF